MRCRLLARLLREIGWLRLALLGPLLLVAVCRGVALGAPHAQGRWAVAGVGLLMLASAHRQRADLRFLQVNAPRFARWLAVEYALLLVPLANGLLLFGAVAPAALLLVAGPLLAWLPAAQEGRSTRQRPRSIFRSEAFEWVSGLRGWAAGLWLALLGLAVWQHPSPLWPGLALGVWLLVVLGIYGTPEPTSMVLLATTPGQFLQRRLLLGLGYGGLTVAPFVCLVGLGPVGGRAVAVEVVWLALLALIILAKYAFYPNSLHIRTTQALIIGVALGAPAHPAYPVLMLVGISGLIWQSRRRLREVL